MIFDDIVFHLKQEIQEASGSLLWQEGEMGNHLSPGTTSEREQYQQLL